MGIIFRPDKWDPLVTGLIYFAQEVTLYLDFELHVLVPTLQAGDLFH